MPFLPHRVVITGFGVLAPNGNSPDAFLDNTFSGRSGIGPITLFDTKDFPVSMAGEVKNFNPANHLEPGTRIHSRRHARHTLFGVAAAHDAARNAGLSHDDLRAEDGLALQVGLSTAALDIIERSKDMMTRRGPRKVSAHTVSASFPHAVANEIAASFNVSCARGTVSSACPSGLEAVARAAEAIRSGKTGMVIAGGADAPITPLTMAALNICGLAMEPPFTPEQASRPFDARRAGGIIGEGACMLVLESLEHALDRGAEPLAEILGHGEQADTPGDENCDGLSRAMQLALTHAGLLPDEIDYINAHGPSHPVIDRMEVDRIKEVFGAHAYRIPVSSIKGVIGNPFAAAGPMQIAITTAAIRKKRIPPTTNYEHPDPDCDLNVVPNHPLPMSPKCCMVNMHGLGGGNSCLILGPPSLQ